MIISARLYSSLTPGFIWQLSEEVPGFSVLPGEFAFATLPRPPQPWPTPRAGPRSLSRTLELFQMLASPRIRSRCSWRLPASRAPTPQFPPSPSPRQTPKRSPSQDSPRVHSRCFSLPASLPQHQDPHVHTRMCACAHTNHGCLGGPERLLNILPQ